MNQNKMNELMDLLQQGLKTIQSEKEFRRYLKLMARFPSYSPRNTLLIFTQMPEATLVAGYSTWKTVFGRHVKKGEKGIRIFAPCSYTKKEIDPETDKIEYKEIHGYRSVSVFDYSQTEGRPLPSPPKPALLQGDFAYLQPSIQALCELSGYEILFTAMDPESRGSCSYIEKLILIDENLSSLHAFKTLIHEISHALLHEPGKEETSWDAFELDDRSIREIEAESSAFVVCSALGLDCSDYSLPYVSIWSSGQNLLKSSLARISKASSSILDALFQAVPELKSLAAS